MNKLRDTKTLTLAAMLTAIGIIIGGYLRFPINQLNEIRFASLPIAMAGMMLGPIPAAVVGALVDIGGFIVHPTGAFFPGFTISGAVSGLLYGYILFNKKPTVTRVIFAQVINTIIIGLGLNTYWLGWMYMKNGYVAALVARLPKELIMLPVNIVVYFIVLKSCERFKYLFLKTA